MNRKGFTLVELIVVVAMLMVLAGALGSAMSGAAKQAKVAKATVETRGITDAIIAYESMAKNHILPTLNREDASEGNLGFILGKGGTDADGNTIPVLYNATLRGNKILDPWGRPYRVLITQGGSSINSERLTELSGVRSTAFIPNFYRLTADDEDLEDAQ